MICKTIWDTQCGQVFKQTHKGRDHSIEEVLSEKPSRNRNGISNSYYGSQTWFIKKVEEKRNQASSCVFAVCPLLTTSFLLKHLKIYLRRLGLFNFLTTSRRYVERELYFMRGMLTAYWWGNNTFRLVCEKNLLQQLKSLVWRLHLYIVAFMFL